MINPKLCDCRICVERRLRRAIVAPTFEQRLREWITVLRAPETTTQMLFTLAGWLLLWALIWR